MRRRELILRAAGVTRPSLNQSQRLGVGEVWSLSPTPALGGLESGEGGKEFLQRLLGSYLQKGLPQTLSVVHMSRFKFWCVTLCK